jgi:dihydrofolate reductase
MRKTIYGAAASLDGYIARTNGDVDWLLWSSDVANVMKDFWKNIDAVIMGRRTYEAGVKQGMPVYPNVKNYVVSRTMSAAPHPDVTIISTDPAAFVRELKAQPGASICIMGGGVLAQALLEAGLVDEVGVNIHPLLLGSGIPLFREMQRQLQLELIEAKTLQHGCVLTTYRVRN